MVRLVRGLWRDFTHAFTGWLGIALAALVGMVLGVTGFTVYYSGFFNYFYDDPQTCAACHAMTEQYEGWQHSSHASVTTCNSCHAPHGNLVEKYINKAENGFMHALKFTTQDYPENIQIRPHNRQVVEEACLYCHSEMVDNIVHGAAAQGEALSCIRCHDGVGHTR